MILGTSTQRAVHHTKRRTIHVVLATACLLPTGAQAEERANVRLSNERTRTVWAHSLARAPILTAPRAGASRGGRLRRFTEDGFREVYLVLRLRRKAGGRDWLQIRLLGRPHGRKGWVRKARLGYLHTVRTRLVVDRRRLRATYFRAGRRVWSAPVGVGAPGTPTPGGPFWIREGFRVRGSGLYGPYAFGTSAYSALSEWPGGGVVGIHGTDQPQLVPGRPSHGCIRMHNEDILWLAERMPLGTPLRIR